MECRVSSRGKTRLAPDRPSPDARFSDLGSSRARRATDQTAVNLIDDSSALLTSKHSQSAEEWWITLKFMKRKRVFWCGICQRSSTVTRKEFVRHVITHRGHRDAMRWRLPGGRLGRPVQ
jgi:hypothetical protein